jgi:tripartite-type tricarboxylate transporter receptor subunit TctC
MPERVPVMPDVPAIAEFVPGYVVSNCFAIFAPANLPLDLRVRLVKALALMRDWPELQAHFAAGAAIARLDGPEPLTKQLREDTTRWAALIKKLGIRAE